MTAYTLYRDGEPICAVLAMTTAILLNCHLYDGACDVRPEHPDDALLDRGQEAIDALIRRVPE